MRYKTCIAFYYPFNYAIQCMLDMDLKKKRPRPLLSLLFALFVRAAFLHLPIASRAFFLQKFKEFHNFFPDLFISFVHSYSLVNYIESADSCIIYRYKSIYENKKISRFFIEEFFHVSAASRDHIAAHAIVSLVPSSRAFMIPAFLRMPK